MAPVTQTVLLYGILLAFALVCGSPTYNPNSDYELISGGPRVVQLKPTMNNSSTTVNAKPVVVNTPPPVAPNSKTFAFDPLTKTWTLHKKTDPQPAEDTLLWNQGNDKWLTNVART